MNKASQSSSLKRRRQPVRQDRRLQAAKAWAKELGPGPHGKAVIHRYKRANKVDLICAIKDLERLGVRLDPTYVSLVRSSYQAPRRKRSSSSTGELPDGYGELWDDNLAYIAGHTSGGWPYGTTWEEDEELSTNPHPWNDDCKSAESGAYPAKPARPRDGSDDDIPF